MCQPQSQVLGRKENTYWSSSDISTWNKLTLRQNLGVCVAVCCKILHSTSSWFLSLCTCWRCILSQCWGRAKTGSCCRKEEEVLLRRTKIRSGMLLLCHLANFQNLRTYRRASMEERSMCHAPGEQASRALWTVHWKPIGIIKHTGHGCFARSLHRFGNFELVCTNWKRERVYQAPRHGQIQALPRPPTGVTSSFPAGTTTPTWTARRSSPWRPWRGPRGPTCPSVGPPCTEERGSARK